MGQVFSDDIIFFSLMTCFCMPNTKRSITISTSIWVRTLEKERSWVSSVFIGAGYRQWISSRAFVGITVLWNLLDDINSPYSNPVFRIGVGIGI